MDLQKDQNVQELLNLLSEHKPDKAQDLSALLFYVDGMERQFDAVLHELQAVKAQLAEVQESSHPLKKALSAFVQGMENRIDQMKERLFEIKESIANTAAKMVDDVKQAGISALDKTVDFLGIREGLAALRDNLDAAKTDTRAQIEKIETMGQELRSVGNHLKNVGRAATGKDLQPTRVDEGKFQSTVLAPLRTTHKALVSMGNITLAAIGNMERLEQAAVRGREPKTSIRQDLQTLKAQADASRPAPEREKKPQEAAL